jgi:hypothetical protein
MENQATSISLSDISEIDFLLSSLPEHYISGNVKGGLSFVFDFDNVTSALLFILTISYTYHTETNHAEEILRYKVKFVFQSPEMEDLVVQNNENQTLEIDSTLINIVLGLSISTVRGMLIVRTQGHPFRFIIPIVNLEGLASSVGMIKNIRSS